MHRRKGRSNLWRADEKILIPKYSELCELCVSVVNNSSQESLNNQNWKRMSTKKSQPKPRRPSPKKADTKLLRENKELRQERDESLEREAATERHPADDCPLAG